MALHVLKVDDVVPLEEGNVRVIKIIPESRIACVFAMSTKVVLTDKWNKKHEFDATQTRVINIAPGYEGPAIRDGVEIQVISRERFRQLKGLK